MFSIAPYHLYGVSCNDKKLASCGMLILLKGEKVDDKVYIIGTSHIFRFMFSSVIFGNLSDLYYICQLPIPSIGLEAILGTSLYYLDIQMY